MAESASLRKRKLGKDLKRHSSIELKKNLKSIKENHPIQHYKFADLKFDFKINLLANPFTQPVKVFSENDGYSITY